MVAAPYAFAMSEDLLIQRVACLIAGGVPLEKDVSVPWSNRDGLRFMPASLVLKASLPRDATGRRYLGSRV